MVWRMDYGNMEHLCDLIKTYIKLGLRLQLTNMLENIIITSFIPLQPDDFIDYQDTDNFTLDFHEL